MKIVATLMVRDEADIVSAMVEHTLAQGVDLIIATDNGSVDGTTQILEEYAATGAIELFHDPVHLKQQHAVVTGMARRARTVHGADWVLNLDADEFCVPVDKSLTLRTALENTPLSLNAFTAPVVNLVGLPARRGSGVRRLVWRDLRTPAQLQEVGIYAQPTPNAVHRGEADVTVAQGNHFVSLKSNGQPAPQFALEVYHLPWRSWEQLERKVVNAGLAYTASPHLTPSKNHHGMADYRRHLGGRLEYAYLVRSPLHEDLVDSETGTYAHDPWLSRFLEDLKRRAVLPHLLQQSLDSDEVVVPAAEHVASARIGLQFLSLERERDEALRSVEKLRKRNERLSDELRTVRRQTPGTGDNGAPADTAEPAGTQQRMPDLRHPASPAQTPREASEAPADQNLQRKLRRLLGRALTFGRRASARIRRGPERPTTSRRRRDRPSRP